MIARPAGSGVPERRGDEGALLVPYLSGSRSEHVWRYQAALTLDLSVDPIGAGRLAFVESRRGLVTFREWDRMTPSLRPGTSPTENRPTVGNHLGACSTQAERLLPEITRSDEKPVPALLSSPG